MGMISGLIDKVLADAAAAQQQQDLADQQQQLIDQAQQWVDTASGIQEPRTEAGNEFLMELAKFMEPGMQDEFRQQVLQGAGYQAVSDAAASSLVNQGTALGNRLSSGLQEDLLGQQSALAANYADARVADRYNQLLTGANLGTSSLGTTGNVGLGGIGTTGSNVNSLLNNIYAQIAQRQQAQANQSPFGSLQPAVDIGLGLYSGYYGGGTV